LIVCFICQIFVLSVRNYQFKDCVSSPIGSWKLLLPHNIEEAVSSKIAGIFLLNYMSECLRKE